MSLSQLFEGGRVGVFWLGEGVPDLEGTAADYGWHVIGFDTRGVADRPGFMAVVAEAFDFAEGFTATWDSLDERLRAVDLDEPDGLLVVWDHWGDFAESDPDGFETALEVFQDACVAWTDDEFGGAVVLRGEGPETDLPEV